MSIITPVAPAVLNVEQACAYVGLCRTKLYEEMKAGTIKYKQAGRKRLIFVSSLDAFLASLPDR